MTIHKTPAVTAGAVALFATGGIAALEQQESTTAGLLLTQIR